MHSDEHEVVPKFLQEVVQVQFQLTADDDTVREGREGKGRRREGGSKRRREDHLVHLLRSKL